LAVDFGRASITAALVALALLERPAFAAPAFVDVGAGVVPSDHDGVPPPHLRLLFDALPAALGPHPGITMAPHFLRGQRVPTLVGFAKTYGADLMAIGRQGRMASAMSHTGQPGPTVRGVLEQAPCSVLVSSGA
jgi:nucleotide-binding universal stress UspA family protein